MIKAEHTLRERLPVAHFLRESFNLVKKWSVNRNPESVNFVPFADVPSIPLKLWTTSYQWAMLNLKVLQTETDSEIICYMCSTQAERSVTKKILKDFKEEEKNLNYRSFDDFTDVKKKVWETTIKKSNVLHSTCTCPAYLKRLTCKHIVGMCIRLQLVNVPDSAKNIPLGQKRKRGRPGRARRALVVQ